MNAYYTLVANKIFPIFGANSIDEAVEFSGSAKVIETSDSVLMNLHTGRVDFSSNWQCEGLDLSDLVEVTYDITDESWIEAKK
jgi:hypothetical protein